MLCATETTLAMLIFLLSPLNEFQSQSLMGTITSVWVEIF